MFLNWKQLSERFINSSNHFPPPQCSGCRFIHHLQPELQLLQILVPQLREEEILIEHGPLAVSDGGALLLLQLPRRQAQTHGACLSASSLNPSTHTRRTLTVHKVSPEKALCSTESRTVPRPCKGRTCSSCSLS